MSGDQAIDLQAIDPRDAAFFLRSDYHEVLARLRAETPVHECAPGLWTVARYEDIRDISRDPALYCSGRGALINDPLRGVDQPMLNRSLLHMDPPEHSAFRGLLNRRFTPRALKPLFESIRKSAVAMLEAAPADADIDFVTELSAPFPLVVIADLLGIGAADRDDFRRWSDAAIESPDLPPGETMAALGELSTFIVELIREKQAVPAEDLVSVLVRSEVNGCPLSKDELYMFLLTLLVAGNETTRTLLSGTALALDEHRDQRALLASTPTLMAGAVEECLRWVTPVQAFCRTTTDDVVLGGERIPSGDYVCMLYASGNRDESVFGVDAGRFDVRRPANPMHVAFGFGEHVCLGASLARLEGRVFLEELLARYPDYEVLGPAERVASTTVAGIRSLPVRLSP